MESVDSTPQRAPTTLGDVAAEDDRALAIRLYQHTKLPALDIGEFVGVSRQTVHNWVNAAGIPLRGTHSGSRLSVDTEDDTTPYEAVADLRVRSVLDAIGEVREDLAGGQETLRALTGRVAALEALCARLTGVVEGALMVIQAEP